MHYQYLPIRSVHFLWKFPLEGECRRGPTHSMLTKNLCRLMLCLTLSPRTTARGAAALTCLFALLSHAPGYSPAHLGRQSSGICLLGLSVAWTLPTSALRTYRAGWLGSISAPWSTHRQWTVESALSMHVGPCLKEISIPLNPVILRGRWWRHVRTLT